MGSRTGGEVRRARILPRQARAPASSRGNLAGPARGQPPAGTSLPETFSAQALLRRVSCAEEFRRRDRPDFWLYLVGYGCLQFTMAFLSINLGALPAATLLVMLGFCALLCFREWHRASPICPNCGQNIRFCTAAFCHVCGKPLANGRCEGCGVGNSWTSLFRPYAKAGSLRWIAYCPGCGVCLDSKVCRWRAGVVSPKISYPRSRGRQPAPFSVLEECADCRRRPVGESCEAYCNSRDCSQAAKVIVGDRKSTRLN